MAPAAAVPAQGTRGPPRPHPCPHLAAPSPVLPSLVDQSETGEFAHLCTCFGAFSVSSAVNGFAYNPGPCFPPGPLPEKTFPSSLAGRAPCSPASSPYVWGASGLGGCPALGLSLLGTDHAAFSPLSALLPRSFIHWFPITTGINPNSLPWPKGPRDLAPAAAHLS